jgi:hypothetical protein
MSLTSNLVPAVLAPTVRNEQGSFLPPVIVANEVVGIADKAVIVGIAESWSDGESKELAGVDMKNKAAIAVRALLVRNGVDKDKLPSFAWLTEVRTNYVSAFMEYEALEEFQRNTADKSWGRLYERAGFNTVPKATNPKAVAEAERKTLIKLAKDQSVGKAMSDAKQDIDQAIANVTAKKDYATLDLLIAKAKADTKAEASKASEVLKPMKTELVKKLNACNNKATLDKIAKLLA